MPGEKETQLRMLREGNGRFKSGRVEPLASSLVSVGSKPSKAIPASTVEAGAQFDRKAYQRVYCRNRLKFGPLANWPASALNTLDTVRSVKTKLGTPST